MTIVEKFSYVCFVKQESLYKVFCIEVNRARDIKGCVPYHRLIRGDNIHDSELMCHICAWTYFSIGERFWLHLQLKLAKNVQPFFSNSEKRYQLLYHFWKWLLLCSALASHSKLSPLMGNGYSRKPMQLRSEQNSIMLALLVHIIVHTDNALQPGWVWWKWISGSVFQKSLLSKHEQSPAGWSFLSLSPNFWYVSVFIVSWHFE